MAVSRYKRYLYLGTTLLSITFISNFSSHFYYEIVSIPI